MRIIFMGSPDFAVPTLDALVEAGHDVIAVYSQPPRPAGRGKALRPTPVHQRAQQLGLTVHTPLSLKSEEEQAAFDRLDADVAIVAAYGLILPQPILDSPRLGCVNVHASLLPRWRGAAPVHRAILAGDRVTGVTLMQMEAGLDTGPMLLRRELPIERHTTAQMTQALAHLGAEMVVEWLRDPSACPARPQPDEGVTYAAKIRKEEARIDWNRGAEEVERQVQALAPYPGAWFEAGGERIKLLAARRVSGTGEPGARIAPAIIACADGAIALEKVQRAGKAPMTAEEWLRGFDLPDRVE